jgi:hypothetical protein
MITLKLAILIFTLLVNTLFLVAVYRRNPRSATHQLFAMLSLVVDFWLLAAYFSTTPTTDLWWARFTIFFAAPMTMFLFLFCHTLPEQRFQLKKAKAAAVVIATLLAMAATLSPYTFTGVDERGLQVGPGMGVFGTLATTFSLLSIYILWRKFSSLTGQEREQVKFVFAGVSLMLGALIFTVMLPLIFFQNDSFAQFIPLYALTFLGMSAYAIVRHRMLDIRLVIARTVSFLALMLITAAAYSLLLFGVFRYAFDIQVKTEVFFGAWLFSIFHPAGYRPDLF